MRRIYICKQLIQEEYKFMNDIKRIKVKSLSKKRKYVKSVK